NLLIVLPGITSIDVPSALLIASRQNLSFSSLVNFVGSFSTSPTAIFSASSISGAAAINLPLLSNSSFDLNTLMSQIVFDPSTIPFGEVVTTRCCSENRHTPFECPITLPSTFYPIHLPQDERSASSHLSTW